MTDPLLIPPARVPARDVDLSGRRYVAQRSRDTVGVLIEGQSGLVDPDGPVTVSVYNDTDEALLSESVAERVEAGTYAYALNPATDTATIGLVSVVFAYVLDGQPHETTIHLDVNEPSPDYDALPEGMRSVVDSVWVRFADLFDSPQGGPHLQVYLQSRFGRNRMAQLLEHAIGRLNVVSQPFQSYSTQDPFPFKQWSSLLSQALYVETIKHLIRSYAEVPDTILATSISRNDRRDYMNRWKTVLDMETADMKDILEMFKMANMNLGSASVMVSGGAYGNIGQPMNMGGLGGAAARGYFVRGGYA